MNKILTLALSGFICLGGLPTNATPEASGGAAAAPAVPTDHQGFVIASLNALNAINAQLSTIADKASADAAADTILPIISELKALNVGIQQLSPPTPEVTQSLKVYQPQFETAFKNFIQHVMLISMLDYHGSEKLKAALETLN